MRTAKLPDGTPVELEATGLTRGGKRIVMVARVFGRVRAERTVHVDDAGPSAVRAEAKRWAGEIRAEGIK